MRRILQIAIGKKDKVKYVFSAAFTVLAQFNVDADKVLQVKAGSFSFASSSSFDGKSILSCV